MNPPPLLFGSGRSCSRQIRTLTAEVRLSAMILVLLPFGVAGVWGIVNRDYLSRSGRRPQDWR